MPAFKWEWVYAQLSEKKPTQVAGDAAVNLMKVWSEIKLNPQQSKETVELFSKLALGEPLVIPIEEDEQWVLARPGAISVGDEMMVLPDAYDNPELAVIHNGRRGRVVRISYGNIVLKYTDGKEPYVDSSHHSPHKLLKRVNQLLRTTVSFCITGDNYDDIVTKTRAYLSEFLDVSLDYIDKKVNIEIKIEEQIESINFSDEMYSAQVIAQVKNV